MLVRLRNYFLICILMLISMQAVSAVTSMGPTDRIQLVTQQINLLKGRLAQSKQELEDLQKQYSNAANYTIETVRKNVFDKANLDLSVTTSNLDTINIELTDCLQTVAWLDKGIQEIENQINVLSIFRLKDYQFQENNAKQLKSDLQYQQKLLALEKIRGQYLQKIKDTTAAILALKKDNFVYLDQLYKSRKLLSSKQQQIKAELAFQQQQNKWLQQLNNLNNQLIVLDPNIEPEKSAAVERGIFYASENANFAYVESLIARYKDQIQQMRLSILNSNSISLLNDIADQIQTIAKQVSKLDNMMKSRIAILDNHTSYLSKRKNEPQIADYIAKLTTLNSQYKNANASLLSINKSLIEVRVSLDQALQRELSSRQGFPTFGYKSLLELGKELLYVPALTYQMVRNLSTNLYKGLIATSGIWWYIFGVMEVLFVMTAIYLRRSLVQYISKFTEWRDQLNTKAISLHWLCRCFIDLAVMANVFGLFYYFGVSQQNFNFLIYLSLVWLIFKSINVISRLCLVESTHDTSGSDARLYYRLKWIFLLGGIITALTVFMHQLPFVFELKTLCDRLFLCLLMVVSILLLRSSEVVPNLILMHTQARHPYLKKSIHLVGVLVPILMFANAITGLFGFVNLIMTISWYEGIFLLVLIAYLIVRGFLTDAMEQASRLMIQYFNNGWLWTEAFLKPLDNVLRISLFLSAWMMLFLLYGWDQQSPIVERLTGLLHYQLISALNTNITPLSIVELLVVISIFYWTAKWTREFVFRLLLSRTKDMGIRNSIAILSQYSIIVLGAFICLRVLGINLQALAFVASMFALGVGLGLRDLVNNFACGFLILLERPLRVGDIVNIGGYEGEVTHIGSRAITVRTWDHMELVVPNTEIFNKLFTNWTAKDSVVRSVVPIKISRYDNPHEIKTLILNVLSEHKDILKDPMPEVFLKAMTEVLMEFELRYYINIRQVTSRTSVVSTVLMKIWDEFASKGIKPPYPQHEIFLRNELPALELVNGNLTQKQ